MNIQLGVFLATMGVSAAIGIYVLLRHFRSFMHRSFSVLVISLAAWGTSIAALYLTKDFIWSSIVFMTGALWFTALLFFSYSFPRGNTPPRHFYLLTIPAILVFILAPFNVFISGFTVDENGLLEPINNLAFLIPFFCIFCSYIAYSLMLVIRNYRRHRRDWRYRMQFRYFFAGIGLLMFSILVFDTILPALGIYQLNLLGPASSLIFFISTSYAIVRHELLDIRLVIQRGIIYTILFVMIIGVYAASLQLLGFFVHEITNIGSVVSSGVITGLGIFFIRPLENYFRKVTDPIFFKNRYNYAEAQHMLAQILYTSLNEEEITSRSTAILKEIFKTDDVEFMLDPKALPTDASVIGLGTAATLAQPIVFDDNMLGMVLLGKKRSGDSYTREDSQLIATFAFQSAIALSKARLHEQVRTYSMHLEQLVEDRTCELKQLQEEQRQTMIDISHNLQTPLAIIRSQLEPLGEDDSEPDNFRAVREALERVSGFIRQLLHLARLEQSLYNVELGPLDLAEVLREQTDYFEVMAEENNARITTRIQGSPVVLGNRRMLEELLANLVANAVNYRDPNREAVINIGLREESGNAVITIKDTGIGIAPTELSDIFTRFYRAGTTTESLSGTGLGLAIAKKIVETHHGSIGVESTLGVGTIFTITFPLRDPSRKNILEER